MRCRIPLAALAGDIFDFEIPEISLAQEMAARGFVAAIIELPQDLYMGCMGENSVFDFARRIYGYDGEGDESSTALAVLCRREAADCTSGIALHGLSASGMLIGMAPRVATGVTAALFWSSGVFVPGGRSCCGMVRALRHCSRAARALWPSRIAPALTAGARGGRRFRATSRAAQTRRRPLRLRTRRPLVGRCSRALRTTSLPASCRDRGGGSL